jgi:hypothetical protein
MYITSKSLLKIKKTTNTKNKDKEKYVLLKVFLTFINNILLRIQDCSYMMKKN